MKHSNLSITTEDIIQEFAGKDDIEIHQFIYDIAKDNFQLHKKNKKWLSANDVERVIDELKKKGRWNKNYIEIDELKQKLGLGKKVK